MRKRVMMTEENNNNYSNNNQYVLNEHQKQHQDITQSVEVKWISKFLLEYPEAALNTRKSYCTRATPDRAQSKVLDLDENDPIL